MVIQKQRQSYQRSPKSPSPADSLLHQPLKCLSPHLHLLWRFQSLPSIHNSVLTLPALSSEKPRQTAQPGHLLQFSSKIMAAPLKSRYVLKALIHYQTKSNDLISCYAKTSRQYQRNRIPFDFIGPYTIWLAHSTGFQWQLIGLSGWVQKWTRALKYVTNILACFWHFHPNLALRATYSGP